MSTGLEGSHYQCQCIRPCTWPSGWPAWSRARRPLLPLCFYGLYAATAGDPTVSSPGDAVIAGWWVVAWAGGAEPGPAVQLGRSGAGMPDRSLLPELGPIPTWPSPVRCGL